MLGLGDDFNFFLPSLQVLLLACKSDFYLLRTLLLAIVNDPREKKTLSKRQFTLFSNYIHILLRNSIFLFYDIAEEFGRP